MQAVAAPEGRPTPGDFLLHPLALAAVLALLLNDHWWKHRFPSWWTGKLSDLAGLLFFPLLLQAAWEIGATASGRPLPDRKKTAAIAAGATALVFALVKTWGPAGEAYQLVLGALQSPFRCVPQILHGAPACSVRRVALARDAIDLFALPAVLASVRIGGRPGENSRRDAAASPGDETPGRRCGGDG